MSVIRHAKDLQEKEAAKNASILLQEVDMEKEREEVKKQAAARRREKKKKKKKNKLAGKDDGDKMAGKEEECEDDDEGMVVEKPESVKNLPKDDQGRWGWARSNHELTMAYQGGEGGKTSYPGSAISAVIFWRICSIVLGKIW